MFQVLDLFQVLLLGGLHLQDPGSQHLHPLAPRGPVAQAHLGREELFRRGRLVVAPLLPLLTVHPLGPLLGSLCGHRRLQPSLIDNTYCCTRFCSFPPGFWL